MSYVIDKVIAGIFAALAAPHRATLELQSIRQYIYQIQDPEARNLCEHVMNDIIKAGEDKRALYAIKDNFESWVNRRFPSSSNR